MGIDYEQAMNTLVCNRQITCCELCYVQDGGALAAEEKKTGSCAAGQSSPEQKAFVLNYCCRASEIVFLIRVNSSH